MICQGDVARKQESFGETRFSDSSETAVAIASR